MKSLLEKFNAKLNAQGGFLKSVSVLVGGTVFAQIIGFICLPILTRLYTPEDYSILGVYVAIVSILAVVSCLRFDIAIPVAIESNEARNIFYLALISNIIFSILILLSIYLSYEYISNVEIIRELSFLIWLIPLGVFFNGLYSALQFWATRDKKFKLIAKTRITQAVFSNTTSISLAIYGLGFAGLILGQLLSYSGGILRLLRNAVNNKESTNLTLKETFLKYKNFPKYSTWEGLANTSAIQLPLIIIAIFLVGPEVGYIMLAMKVLGIPMGLIGSAISQVYLSQASEYHNNKKLFSYTLEILKKILKIVFLPFLFLMVSSPYIFGYIFGKEWNEVGLYIMAMIPWYFMQILSSPISMALHVLSKQKLALFMQVLGFLIRVVLLLIIFIINNEMAIYYYIVSGFLFYSMYFFAILYLIKSEEMKCMH